MCILLILRILWLSNFNVGKRWKMKESQSQTRISYTTVHHHNLWKSNRNVLTNHIAHTCISLKFCNRDLQILRRERLHVKIFSILSRARTWASVILAGKLDSCHCSTMSFMEVVVLPETIYQMWEVLSFFSGERA